jgi:hypothetical protein
MSHRNRILWAVVWAASLLVTAHYAKAQDRRVAGAPVTQPTIISGGDVGFRVWSNGPSGPVGEWVVRVDGRWLTPQMRPATGVAK